MPQWLKNRLPTSLGGDKDIYALESMTLDSYAKSLKTARQIGAVTGFVGGTSRIQDPLAQGNLRLYEDIVGAMTVEEKADLSEFTVTARQRVASEIGCTVCQVDDCIAKFEWMKQMTTQMAALKRQGKPIPKSVEDLEQSVGNWRGYREQQPQSSAAGPGVVASNQVDSRGRACPLRGMTVGRSTKCRLTNKSWKSCCGKTKYR